MLSDFQIPRTYRPHRHFAFALCLARGHSSPGHGALLLSCCFTEGQTEAQRRAGSCSWLQTFSVNTDAWLLRAALEGLAGGAALWKERSPSALPLAAPGPLLSAWGDAAPPAPALTAAGPGVLCPSPDAPAIYPHRRGEERKCLEVLCWPRSRLAGCSSASPQEGSTAGTRAVGEGGCTCRRNRRAPAPGEGCLGQGSEGRQLLLLFHLSGAAHTGPLGSRHSCLQEAWEPACTTSSSG